MATESERLEEAYRKQNIKFRELSDRTKTLADKSLATTLATVKLQAQTSAASNSLRGISNVASSLKDAITQAAKNNLFIGNELQRTTEIVKTASSAYDEKTKELRRVKEGLGEEARTISGINQIEKARKAAAVARTELFNREIEQIDSAIVLQQQVIDRTRQELDGSERSLAITQAAIAADEAAIAAKTTLIETIQDSIVSKQKDIDTDKDSLKFQKEYKEASESMLAGFNREAAAKQGLIDAIEREIAIKDENIAQENVRKTVYASDLSAVQARVAAIQAEITDSSLTAQQRSVLESLRRRELEQLAESERTLQGSIADLDARVTAEVQERIDLGNTLRTHQSELSDINDEIRFQNAEIAASTTEISRLTAAIESNTGDLELLQAQLKVETDVRAEAVRRLGKLKTEENSLIKAVQDQKDALENATATMGELQDDRADKIAQEAVEKQKDLNATIAATRDKLNIYGQTLSKVATNLNKLVAPILELQKQFGVSAGTAAKLKFQNLSNAVDSYITSLIKGGPAVSAKEIETTQGAFQAEFGGVLTSDAARGLAEEAKRLGVGASELAKARRVFMTQTMGDADKAQAQTDKFVAEFAKKGLTASDAMKAIGQNSELLARNGTRFATSFARAAADAKKIGVDLSKVDQIGDSIIGDFEGFLEKTSELGAMGFNLDTTRLAEIAESGDTGQLFNELRSQLASTGKDITKLRRSEQLALSQTFGMSIEEFQRMAAPPGTEGSGKQTLSPEDLQREANKSLGDLVFRTDAMIGILGTAVTILGVIASNTAMGALKSLLGGSMPGLSGGISSGVGGALTSNAVKIGGSVLAGGVGAFMGFKTAKEKGKDNYEAAGAGTVQGASAAAGAYGGSAVGAAIGTAILPGIGTAIGAVIGPAVGGFLGNTFGKAINTYFPSVAANLGGLFKGFTSAFEPVKTAFSGLKDAFKPLTTAFGKLFDVFKPAGDAAGKASPIFEVIGSVIGTLVAGPLTFLIDVLKIGIQLITIAVDGWRMLFQALKDVYTYLSDKFTQIGTVIKDAWNGIIDWIASKIPDWMKKGASAVSNAASSVMAAPGKAWEGIKGFFNNAVETTAGDDVVSKPGYGERSLVTPTGVIALNNKDNIVAYADDLVGTTKLPYGAITKNVAELGLDTGPLIASLFEKGTSVFGGKGAGALSHLGKMLTGNAGMAKYDFIPRTIQTMFGTTGKFAPAAMKFLAQNAKAIPIIGSLIGGGLTGYSEFKESGSIGRAIAKGLFSAGGGMLGSVGAGALTAGNPIAASVGGLAGSKGGEALFDTLFGNGKMKSSAASSKLPVRKADDFISTGGSTGGTNLPLGTISKLKEPSVQIPNISTLMGPPQTTTTTAPTVVEKTVKIDTSGIEQKLNGFIAALQGMQINLDGVRVGNALVNSTNTSTKLGVMTTQARTGI